MSIPYKFNPMGAGAEIYHDFVQPRMLANTTINTTQPYSFGMRLDGDSTACLAFDGLSGTVWSIASSRQITIYFDKPLLLEQVQHDWLTPTTYVQYMRLISDDTTIVEATRPSGNMITLATPTTITQLTLQIQTVRGMNAKLKELKFIGKYAD